MLSKKITIISILILVSLALIGQNSSTLDANAPSSNSLFNNNESSTSDAVTEIMDISAIIGNEIVQINWNLNNTNNLLGFELYKSTDGNSWEMMTFVDNELASGDSFSFVDESPNWGINFYRIKAVNIDGDYSFLKTTKVVYEYTTGANVGNFYPNPATNGKTNIDIEMPNGGEATIRLYDNTGKLLGTYQKTISHGTNTISLDLINVYDGMLYANINVNRETYSRKIMLRTSK